MCWVWDLECHWCFRQMQKNSLSLCSVLTILNSFCVGCFSSQISSEFFPAIITLPLSRLGVSHLALVWCSPKWVTIVVLLWQGQPISKSLSRAMLLESSCSAEHVCWPSAPAAWLGAALLFSFLPTGHIWHNWRKTAFTTNATLVAVSIPGVLSL